MNSFEVETPILNAQPKALAKPFQLDRPSVQERTVESAQPSLPTCRACI